MATESGASTRVRRAFEYPCSIVTANNTSLVDYILFIKADVDLAPNPNEARDVKYVTADELKGMFKDSNLKFTPWFKLICESLLFEWWEHLDAGLEKYENETEIRRM